MSAAHRTHYARLWLITAALSLIAGCASLGLTPADSFDARLAYAYGTHTAVLQAASAAVNAGTLSKKDGSAVLTLGEQSRTLLDSARAVEGTDPTTAAGRLALAVNILSHLPAETEIVLGEAESAIAAEFRKVVSAETAAKVLPPVAPAQPAE